MRVARVERLLSLYGDKFLRRAFHASEIAVVQQSQSREAAARFAASRWAVKEAVFKAVGGRWRLRFPDVYVAPLDASSRRPALRFDGDTAVRMAAIGVAEPFVSISHEDQYAIAQVILCRNK